jgi:preprotein translocase subunit Sec63
MKKIRDSFFDRFSFSTDLKSLEKTNELYKHLQEQLKYLQCVHFNSSILRSRVEDLVRILCDLSLFFEGVK